MALLFTVSSAMKFITMAELGKTVHSSVKTIWFAYFSTVCIVIFMAFYEPEFYAFWRIGTDSYPMNKEQFIGSFIIGFFSWAS